MLWAQPLLGPLYTLGKRKIRRFRIRGHFDDTPPLPDFIRRVQADLAGAPIVALRISVPMVPGDPDDVPDLQVDFAAARSRFVRQNGDLFVGVLAAEIINIV